MTEHHRRLELTDGASDKFWDARVDGSTLTIWFGRRGTAGQTRPRTYADAAAARAELAKVAVEKLRKGYRDVDAESSASPPPAPAPPADPPANPPAPPPYASPCPADPSAVPAPPRGAPRPSLDLTPAELASNAAHPLVAPAPPRAFDLAARLRQLKSCRTVGGSAWVPSEPFPDAVGAEEAAFWFTAGLHGGPGFLGRLTPMTDRVAAVKAAWPVDPRSVPLGAPPVSLLGARLALACLVALHGADATLEHLTAPFVPDTLAPHRHDERAAFTPHTRQVLLPRCSDEALAAARRAVAQQVVPAAWHDGIEGVPPAFALAAQLGLTEQVRPVVESWPDGRYDTVTTRWSFPRPVVLALDDPGLVARTVRRTGLTLSEPWSVTAFLAATGETALEVLAEQLVAVRDKADAVAAAGRAAHHLHGPAAVPLFARLLVEGQAAAVASAWFADHAAVAPGAAGLLTGRHDETLLAVLFRAAQADPDGWDAGLAALRAEGPDAADRLERRLERAGADLAEVTPDWLVPPPGRAPTLPHWAEPAGLPPLVVDGGRLAPRAVGQLLHAGPGSDLAAAVRRHATPASRDAFVLALLRAWLADDAPSKHRWALPLLGTLGDEGAALELAPMVRAWAKAGKHARAAQGLEVLAAMDTRASLLAVSSLAEDPRAKALQVRATAAMESIAAARGLTVEELEDRAVPTAGLDAPGGLRLDLGGRQVAVTVDGAGPRVRLLDAAGAAVGPPRTDLPSRTKADDPAAYASAKQAWQTLRRTVAAAVAVQAARLERSMVTGRRWAFEDLRTLVLEHPLVGGLATGLVWGAWDAAGGLVATFRVTAEGDLADAADRQWAPPAGVTVGVVHPLLLDAATAAAWSDLLGEYAVVQPFPQLGRAVLAATDAELAGTTITRFAGPRVAAGTFLGTLDRLGWYRGAVFDSGCYEMSVKPFVAHGVSAVVRYEGVPVGYLSEADDQDAQAVYVVPGVHRTGFSDDLVGGVEHTRVPLQEVHPVVLSEVLADLTAVVSRARA